MDSITHIVDGGKVLNEYEYDAWGEVVSSKETVKNRFKFNGQQLDPITGQYYLRARFYNPVIARFTQEDTYRGDGLNLYAYCKNNPVYYVDPTGYARNCVKEAYDKIRAADSSLSPAQAHALAMQQAGVKKSNQPKKPNDDRKQGYSDPNVNSQGQRVLSRQDTVSTIKSVRRQVEKLMKNDPKAQQMLKNGQLDLYGTYFHNRVFKRIKTLNIAGLEIDKNIYRQGTDGGKGNIRRPDFQWKRETDDYEIWDLKPNGTDWSKTSQYQDIYNWTGIEPIQLNYNR